MSDQSSAYCYPNYYGWDFDSSTGVNTFIERELTEEEVTVKLLGGDLKIRWDREENLVYMTGSATTVFDGEIQV